MCTITATEFKTNFGKYLELSMKEDILITKNGKPFSTLSRAKSDEWQDFADKWSKVKKYNVDEEDPRIAKMLGKL